MRDDKSYPYMVIDKREDFPRLEYKRRIERHRDVKVYGPFATGSNIVEVIRILTRSFALRDCGLRDFISRKEPCILYQMHQCTAACVGKIDRDHYMKDLQLALGFFEGKADESLKILEERMEDYAKREEFEQALLLRDNRQVLQEFIRVSKQKNAEIKRTMGYGCSGLLRREDRSGYHHLHAKEGNFNRSKKLSFSHSGFP